MNTKDEFIRRCLLYKQISEDKKALAYEYELCKRSVSHFCRNWVLTFDPRRQPKHFPFIPYEFQEEVFEWIDAQYKNQQNGLIEKSRDMGVTWLVSVWAVHKWLFDSGFSCLFGSRKESLVDDKTINSVFGKLRYIIYRLPSFLRPNISPESKTDSYMRLIHPENENEITGESTNMNFGRGGRSSICFLDEFAHVDHSEVIWAAISDNSDCIIPLSTPNGKDNEFYRLKSESNVPVLSVHWSKHPLKTNEWYENRKKEMQPWQIAQELDLSYERSKRGIVYQQFDRRYHVASKPIEREPLFEQFVTWDFGVADPTVMIFGQITVDGVIQIYSYLELTDKDIDFFIPIAIGKHPPNYELLDEETKKKIRFVMQKAPFRHDADHFGDHAGTTRSQNSVRSCKRALKDNGIDLQTSGKQTHDWRFRCLNNLLKLRYNETRKEWYSIFQVSPDCERVIDCFTNYVWQKEEDVSDENIKPKHNWASHIMSAIEFFAINRFPIKNKSHSGTIRIR